MQTISSGLGEEPAISGIITEQLPTLAKESINFLALDLATQGYGVGNWYLYNGEEDEARRIFEHVLSGDYWAAFGYIAAEAELVRM